jgi:hypothetical protein
MSHLERLKQAKRELAAERQAVCEASYRAMLRRAFELVAQGSEASRAECAQVLDRLAALTDDIGVTRGLMPSGTRRGRAGAPRPAGARTAAITSDDSA